MARLYDVRNFTIDGSQWWAITASIDCNYFSLRCPSDTHVRTVPGDANTEDDLPAGVQEAVSSTMPPLTPGTTPIPRWRAGDVVIYAKSQAGSEVVIARFLL